MAIVPPIMNYPLGTDYYDVEIFNNNWKNSLTYLDNNFLNNERVLTEQLSTSTTNVLNATASNALFENGVGADVLGYIEDGASHEVGTVWLSRNNKGEYKCLIANSDNYIDMTPGAEKWAKIDDLSNYNLSNTLIGLNNESNKLQIRYGDASFGAAETHKYITFSTPFTKKCCSVMICDAAAASNAIIKVGWKSTNFDKNGFDAYSETANNIATYIAIGY